MKKLFILYVFVSILSAGNLIAMWEDETNTANPTSRVSETKSLDAARPPQRTVGGYSKAGYSPYSTAAPVRIDQIIDPDARTATSAPVSSVEDAISQIRLKAGMSPR